MVTLADTGLHKKSPCYIIFNDRIIIFERFTLEDYLFMLHHKITDHGRIDVNKWVCYRYDKDSKSIKRSHDSTMILRRTLSV